MKRIPAKLLPASALFADAYAASRRWDRLVRRAVARYGDVTGTHISGIYADHFPKAVKNRLRACARTVTARLEAAWAARPPYVRNSTMMRVKQFVVARDGKGYYG